MDELSDSQPDSEESNLEARLQDLKRQLVERRGKVNDLRASVQSMKHVAGFTVVLRNLARGLAGGFTIGLVLIVALMVLLRILGEFLLT